MVTKKVVPYSNRNMQNSALTAQTLIDVLKHIMLIKNLYNLFCGSEPQKGRLDSSIPPSEIVEKENTTVIIPRKFKDDVERLCSYCGVVLKRKMQTSLHLFARVQYIAIFPRKWCKGLTSQATTR